MHLSNVNRTQLISPLVRPWRHFVAHRQAHLVPGAKHFRQRHVAEAAHRGVAYVGPQGTTWIGIFKQVRHRIANPHFVPNADSHRRAFFRINRFTAAVFLIQTPVNHIALAQPVDDQCGEPQIDQQKMQPWFVCHFQHFSEKNEHLALPLLHNRIHSKKLCQTQQKRNAEHQHQKGNKDSGKEFSHFFTSK